MNALTCRTSIVGILIAALLPVATAHAQLEGLLKKGESGGVGNLGEMGKGLSAQSLGAGSVGNAAGVLQYCISNNYLGGEGASSVKDKLMGKLPGGSASSDTGYKDGAKGLLHSSDGKQLDLSGTGLKAEATRQICDRILAQGKSML